MPASCVLNGSAVRFRPTLPDLDGAAAEEIIAWAVDRFGSGVGVACSLRDTVLLDPALRVDPGAARYDTDGTAACCQARKVAPLERYLAGKGAWISGLRRAESPTRAAARPVEWDAARAVVKINPIVEWTDADVACYSAARNLIVNPLRSCGYNSIGCSPCTNPGRGCDGRWPGRDKVECGIHLAAPAPVNLTNSSTDRRR